MDLEKAKLTIDRSVIRAPFDGIVVDRTARVGQKVLIDDTTPLFKVSADAAAAGPDLLEGELARQRAGRRRRRGDLLAVQPRAFNREDLLPVSRRGSGQRDVSGDRRRRPRRESSASGRERR